MIRVTKVINKKQYAINVQEYIEECFNVLNVNYDNYFSGYYTGGTEVVEISDNEYEEIPVGERVEKITCYDSNYDINYDMVDYTAWILGLTRDDILSMNRQIIKDRIEKYPFFELLAEANDIYKTSFLGGFTDQSPDDFIQNFFDVLFGKADGLKRDKRFDYSDVKNRLDHEIQHMKEFFPDIYHDGQSMVHLSIETNTIIHYRKTSQMVRSFIDMVDQLTALFEIFLKSGFLCSEDIREFNFLSTSLNIRYHYLPSGHSFLFDDISRARDWFIEEGYSTLFDVACLPKETDFQPWRFAEFADDPSLAQSYMNLFPGSKKQMTDFIKKACNFKCKFWWKDDFDRLQEHLKTEDDFDTLQDHYLKNNYLDESLPSFLSQTVVYIEKKPEELYCEKETAKKLAKLCQSSKLGGLTVNRIVNKLNPIHFMNNAFGVIQHKDFLSRVLDRRYIPGGEDDE